MNRFFRAALLLLLASPAALSAQGLAVGARAGSMGLGGEVALGLSDTFVLRGGLGVFPYEYDGEFDEEEYTVTFPTSIWSAGIDFYPGGGSIRFMGGIMGRSGDLEAETRWTDGREIGDQTFSGSGSLKGTLDQGSVAPFIGLGFGKHTAGRFGFFMDIGVAFTGEPDVKLKPGGEVASLPGIDQALREEEAKIQDDSGNYLKYWPMLSLGFKLPISGGY